MARLWIPLVICVWTALAICSPPIPTRAEKSRSKAATKFNPVKRATEVMLSLLFSDIKESLTAALGNNYACGCPGVDCEVKFHKDLKPPKYERAGKFDPKVALYLANLVVGLEISESKDRTVKSPERIRLVQTLDIPEIKGGETFIGALWFDPKTEIAYLAFRGTQTRFEWGVDFAYGQMVQPWKRKVPKSSDDCVGGRKILLHEGFLLAYLSLRRGLLEALKDLNPRALYITGHSLGGALANVAASDILSLPDTPEVRLYTFASPRVGNMAWGRYMRAQNNLTEYYQIKNEDDLVPQLPLAVMPCTEDPEKPWYYQHAGDVVSFRENRLSIKNNHLLPVYIKHLETREYAVVV